MATELLPIASGAANSADFTLAAGETATICRKDASAPSIASGDSIAIQLKDDAGAYWDVYSLIGEYVACVLSGIGTYRVRRVSGAVGAFRG
jgi:hypothetical protein